MSFTLQNTAKTFADGTRALLPTNLTIEEGRIVSLLGPSGCGKTTLLRLIAGLETPDPGSRILFGGDDVTAVPIERRQVGMVFQSYALFPNMSVRANIAYGLKMRKLPRERREARVAEVLKLCRLEPFADRAISALSGGQRQRVALARAVAPRPRLLLLDEPLSALDAALRDQLRDELAGLLREVGTTAIFVTHDQAEAMAIADQVAVMSGGRILQLGTPQALYSRPATEFVARFIGDAMPLGGPVEGDVLHLPGGSLRLPEPGRGRRPFVRAENIRLSADGPLAGVVERLSYRGSHYRIAVAGAAAQLLHADHAAGEAPAPGSAVRLDIAPDAILLIEESETA